MAELLMEHYCIIVYANVVQEYMYMRGRPQRGGEESICTPLELEKMVSYAALLRNILQLSLVPLALATNTTKFSPLQREKRKKFCLQRGCIEQWAMFLAAPKNCQLF